MVSMEADETMHPHIYYDAIPAFSIGGQAPVKKPVTESYAQKSDRYGWNHASQTLIGRRFTRGWCMLKGLGNCQTYRILIAQDHSLGVLSLLSLSPVGLLSLSSLSSSRLLWLWLSLWLGLSPWLLSLLCSWLPLWLSLWLSLWLRL